MKTAAKLIVYPFFLFAVAPAQSQGLIKKLKQKAEQAADKMVDKKIDKAVEEKTGVEMGNSGDSKNTSGTGGSGRSGNKGGAGLVTTPPDVNQNLTDAEASFKTGKFAEARYAVQQAMLGVEMEIGKKILKGLPETVLGLSYTAGDDQVTSTGWGWVGLTIQRKYEQGEKELRTTIANNSVWMSAVNLYLANGGYAQTTGDNQKWKQTKVKGNRAVIEFDESSGYKLTLPIGQTSLIVWEGINFATEQEVMDAANAFDIESIKKTLGEK